MYKPIIREGKLYCSLFLKGEDFVKVVRKLSTGTVHVVKDDYYTACGKAYRSKSVNQDIRLGFARAVNPETVLNKPKVDCKSCLKSLV